jgi:hypothetical protein
LNTLGMILMLISSGIYWVYFYNLQILTPKTNYFVYPTSFLSGISLAISLNTGISYISDVVGKKGKQGAFVYGVYGLLDKFSCGILLFLVMVPFFQYFQRSESFETKNLEYIKFVFVVMPFLSCVLSWLLI